MNIRKKIAWKLVRVANVLHDPEWVDVITAESPGGDRVRITVVSDEYGSGISAISGLDWSLENDADLLDAKAPLVARQGDWTFKWGESPQEFPKPGFISKFRLNNILDVLKA